MSKPILLGEANEENEKPTRVSVELTSIDANSPTLQARVRGNITIYKPPTSVAPIWLLLGDSEGPMCHLFFHCPGDKERFVETDGDTLWA